MKKGRLKRLISITVIAALLAGSIMMLPVSAKTQTSAKGQQLFFYVADKNGKAVLADIIPYSQLESMSHGQADGSNYWYSSTDNYPTTQYCEARGFTIQELMDYVKKSSDISGKESLTFSGEDSLSFMATDSYGIYTRTWTAENLTEKTRYYFEGLYDSSKGWKSGWEAGGEDKSKFGMDMDEYLSSYASSDAYYNDKKEVFEGGQEMPVILATESYSGRTTSQTLTSSTEPGLASYISQNGGVTAGCLKNSLSDACSLRLCIPMSQEDLFTAHRTSYDNFKWVYNVLLTDTSSEVVSKGTVQAPEASFAVDGNTLKISLSCGSPDAEIYYSFDGAPQSRYTGTISYDITGRNPASDPVTIYMTAVKEGYDDAGVVTAKYPQSGVTFETLYSEKLGTSITFRADSSTSASDWKSWSGAIMAVSMKKPETSEYASLKETDYTINDSDRSITFSSDLFDQTGAYSFIAYAKGYSNKSLSVSLKKAAPALSDTTAYYGADIEITFSDSDYGESIYAYAMSAEDQEGVLIPVGCLDRSQKNKLVIKKSYFDSASCAFEGPGNYIIELTNNNYTPAAQRINLTLTGAGEGSQAKLTDFTDVASGAWYEKAVAYAKENALFSGTSATTFSPDSNMTRGMLVTVLYRMEGSPEVSSQGVFSDVASDQYYSAPVAWAYSNGIVSGISADLFSPSSNVTRQQLAAILMRYADYKGKDVSGRADLSTYRDRNSISAYALEAAEWAVDSGLMSGVAADSFSPLSGATRAQVAQILMRYCQG